MNKQEATQFLAGLHGRMQQGPLSGDYALGLSNLLEQAVQALTNPEQQQGPAGQAFPQVQATPPPQFGQAFGQQPQQPQPPPGWPTQPVPGWAGQTGAPQPQQGPQGGQQGPFSQPQPQHPAFNPFGR